MVCGISYMHVLCAILKVKEAIEAAVLAFTHSTNIQEEKVCGCLYVRVTTLSKST